VVIASPHRLLWVVYKGEHIAVNGGITGHRPHPVAGCSPLASSLLLRLQAEQKDTTLPPLMFLALPGYFPRNCKCAKYSVHFRDFILHDLVPIMLLLCNCNAYS
jgi:hypothetical protein